MGLGRGVQADEEHFVERGEPRFFVYIVPAKPSVPYYGPPVNVTDLAAAKRTLANGQLDFDNAEKYLDTGRGPGGAELTPEERNLYTDRRKDLTERLLSLAAQISAAEAKVDAYNANPPKPPMPAPPVNPQDLDLSQDILSFEYEESEKKIDVLKLTVENADLRYFDHILFEKGTKLRVSWGYAGAMAPPRVVTVLSVKGARTLTVEAQGGAVEMDKVGRTRSFDNRTRSDIVRQIAEENGFAEAEQFIEDTTVRAPVTSQGGLTDAKFCKRLADLEHFEFFVDFDGFHWHPRRLGQKPVRKLAYYLPPNVGDIIDFNVENDVTAKPGKVETKGRDPLTKKDVGGTGSDTTTKRDTLAAIPEVQPGTASDAKPGSGPGLEVDPRSGSVKSVWGSEGETSVQPTTATNPVDAKKQADGAFKRTSLTAVQMTLDLVGDPNLVAKTTIEITGLGKRLSGKYYITELSHKLGSGYTMSAKVKTDGGNHGVNKKADPAKANLNTKDAADPNALHEELTVDPKTGEVKKQFFDARGRDSVTVEDENTKARQAAEDAKTQAELAKPLPLGGKK